MKYEVIALTSFVTDGRTDGRTPSILMSPQWLRHGGRQKYYKNEMNEYSHQF